MSLKNEYDLKETELMEQLIEIMDKFELKEKTIKVIVTTDLLPTNFHLEKMLVKLKSLQKPTDELVLAIALGISDEN